MLKLQKTTTQARSLAAVLLLATAALVVCRLSGMFAGAAVTKLVASSAFLAVAATSGAFESRYGRIIFTGLVCSWFGDMFLLGDGRAFFLAGLVSFLLGHLAYIVAFSVHGLNDKWTLCAFLPIAAIALVVSAWLTPQVPADMVIPVRVYTFVISLMVTLAFGAKGAGGPLLIPLGAVLFYLSDLSVASLQFTNPAFPHYVWGLPFYYTGQLLLALSVMYTRKGTLNE